MAKNYRYEVVFRTVYLDEDFDEVGTETECILFSRVSGNSLCVDKNINCVESRSNGEINFVMGVKVPKEK